ncbi:uncharacterized protein LOC113202049 [Frankliniella occidentalis]|uniref:Uncharacterized protein LOC113202049 n=1 Tax=Frankliniella occidentalis TaxID=133901 RepID=A0A6J1RSL0_FRAOC|nr:uncharacterized protein LOC113202049 [Frankliniella occidentalis]
MDHNEQSALLPSRHEPTAGSSVGYSSIVRVEPAPAPASSIGDGDGGFRAREYARLRRVVLFVTGLTTVLIGAGLLVGLLVPATVRAEPDSTPALVILPVP